MNLKGLVFVFIETGFKIMLPVNIYCLFTSLQCVQTIVISRCTITFKLVLRNNLTHFLYTILLRKYSHKDILMRTDFYRNITVIINNKIQQYTR